MRLLSLLRRYGLTATLTILLAAPSLADERAVHEALFRLFAPREMATSELCQQAYDELSGYAPAHALWQRLDQTGLETSALQARLEQEGPTSSLQARQLYQGWLYEGERGRRWAGLPGPQARLSPPPPQPPRLPRCPSQVVEGEIRMEGGELDYLIVGSGPAGAVLGHQLSEAGFEVAIVERGSFVLPGAVDTRDVPALKVGGGAVPTTDGGVLVRNANAVGGGSTVNVDLAFPPTLPIVEQRLRQWRERGWIGSDQWTPAQVETAYAWVTRTIGTRVPSPLEINANNRILWEGGKAIGLQPALYALNTWPGQPPWSDKRSAVNGLLLEAMTREQGPLRVFPDLEARTILVENGRAVGISALVQAAWTNPSVWRDPYGWGLVPGSTVTLRARRIILCAGAQGSAALLLRSGLGQPAVGRGVILHPSIPLIGRFPTTIDATVGTPSTVYAVDPQDPLGVLYECMTAGPQYVALMLFGGADEVGERVRDFRALGGFGVLVIDSVDADNRILLDADGEPQVIYRLAEGDRRRFARAIGRAARAMLAAGASEVYLPSIEPYAGVGQGKLMAFTEAAQTEGLEERLRFRPGATVVTSAHMQSTCKMGSDPSTSVVDFQHRVRGVDNLYICDSSVFPASIGANPMQAVYTIAKLFADQLVRESPCQLREEVPAKS